MKTRLFLLLAFTATSTFALKAQNEAENPPIRFEAQLAFDITTNTGARSFYDSGAGFNAGVNVQIPLPSHLSFTPGILFYYTGWNVTNDRLEALKLYSGSTNNFGMRVPLNFGYTFNLSDELELQAYTGPWVNVNFLAKQTLSAAPGSEYEKGYDSNLFHDGFKRVDAQWGIGAKLTWADHYTLGVSFGAGMTPIRVFSEGSREMTQRRNSFQINLAYRF